MTVYRFPCGSVSADQMRNRLAVKIAAAGSLRALARQWKVSPAHLSDIMHGHRGPGEVIAKRLGLKRFVVPPIEPSYEEIS